MCDILVVDDDAMVCALLNDMLIKEGHITRMAANGKIACDLVRQRIPDIIITDIIMPEKEGLEMIVELKHDYPGIKIIAISGVVKSSAGSFDYLDAASKLGAHECILKPFSRETILTAIQKVKSI